MPAKFLPFLKRKTAILQLNRFELPPLLIPYTNKAYFLKSLKKKRLDEEILEV